MNLSFRKKTKLIGFIVLFNFLTFVLGWVARSVYYDITWEDVLGDKAQILSEIEGGLENQFQFYEKEVEFQEASPDGKNIITLYKLPYNPTIYTDYYKDYFQNQKIIAVKNLGNQKEDYIFIGEERTGNPHWLGNNHIFFTTYCGTACQGLYLVDTRNKEARLAIWAYISADNKKGWETQLKDWFGREFKFTGLVNKIESETTGGKTYLIFKRKDGQGKPLNEKRFLFTEEDLLEEK